MLQDPFLETLRRTQDSIPDMGCVVVPTSFEPDAVSIAFPRPASWRWDPLERALRTSGSRGVMLRLPLFWQVEAAVFRACRSARCSLFVSDRKNMPVAAEALEQRVADCVITDVEDADNFASYLAARHIEPATWYIVHPLIGPKALPASLRQGEAAVIREVQIFPSMSVFEQCPYQSQKKSGQFHICEAFSIELETGRALITSTGNDPLPILRYELPTPVAHGDICPCGRAGFTIG